MINLRNVHKSFGSNAVLNGVDLEIGVGNSMAVIGASGCGKSVMLKIILGLMSHDQGDISVDGHRRIDMDRVGMLFQGGALFDSLPVWQNVAFRLLRQMPRAEARAIALDKLARVGLDADVADRLPAELSGGMQKRAGMARAIAGDPAILFFDEPTSGLDPIMAGRINRLIRSIVTEMNVTALTISHDMTTVNTVADQVALLHEGRIRWNGSQAALASAKDPYVRAFVRGEDPREPSRDGA